MISISKESLILLILIPLIVGLLTNAVWETLFKKYIPSLGRGVLRISSLGVKKTINRIYLDVGKKNIHRNQLFIVFLIVTASSMALGATSAAAFRDEISYSNSETIKAQRAPEEIRKEMTRLKKNMEYSFFLFSLFFFMIAQYNYFRNSYINNAVLHFDQALRILGVAISDRDRIQLESRFALIKGKDDYTKILRDLEEIAKNNSLEIPDFVPL